MEGAYRDGETDAEEDGNQEPKNDKTVSREKQINTQIILLVIRFNLILSFIGFGLWQDRRDKKKKKNQETDSLDVNNVRLLSILVIDFLAENSPSLILFYLFFIFSLSVDQQKIYV